MNIGFILWPLAVIAVIAIGLATEEFSAGGVALLLGGIALCGVAGGGGYLGPEA